MERRLFIMENFESRKRCISWKCRRKAEEMTVSQFAEAIGVDVEKYYLAENGIYDQKTYRNITNGIMDHNHSFGANSIKYYRIRMAQGKLEYGYAETEEERERIIKHYRIHKSRYNKAIKLQKGEMC